MDLLDQLQHAEFKEAFDEFDKVSKVFNFKASRWQVNGL